MSRLADATLESSCFAVLEALEPRMLLAASPLQVVDNRLENDSQEIVRLTGVNVPSPVWSSVGDRVLESTIVALDDWNANTIRLAVSQDRWFGHADGVTDGWAAYRQRVDNVVQATANRDAYVILDLHWANRGVWGQWPNQYRMPDNRAYHGRFQDLLPSIPDGGVTILRLDPPYVYGDEAYRSRSARSRDCDSADPESAVALVLYDTSIDG